MSISSVAVVFCDQVYRGALGIRGEYTPQEEREYFWSPEKIRAWAQKTKGVSVVTSSHDWRERSLRMTLDDYFSPFDVPDKLRRYMILNKISILVEEENDQSRGEEKSFQVNPVGLKQLGFAKAIDPYSAFQELSMWIGGVLGGTSPEIVSIKDDKTLLEGHGFDNVTSFRGPRV